MPTLPSFGEQHIIFSGMTADNGAVACGLPVLYVWEKRWNYEIPLGSLSCRRENKLRLVVHTRTDERGMHFWLSCPSCSYVKRNLSYTYMYQVHTVIEF